MVDDRRENVKGDLLLTVLRRIQDRGGGGEEKWCVCEVRDAICYMHAWRAREVGRMRE